MIEPIQSSSKHKVFREGTSSLKCANIDKVVFLYLCVLCEIATPGLT